MARRKIPIEVVGYWQSKGMVICADAQADGVPCPTLGRRCETCALALRELENASGSTLTLRRELRT